MSAPPRVILRGLLIDPAAGVEAPRTVVIEGDRVTAIEAGAVLARPGDRVLEGPALWIVPGLIDLHVHLREPGDEHKETFATGGAAAAAGGFTTVLAMGNTSPPPDSGSRVAAVLARAAKGSAVRVFTVGTVTAGLAGESLTEAQALAAAGAVALSDDGKPIVHAGLMRRALEQAGDAGLPLLAHEEEPALVGKGCMQEGPTATRLGLGGIPSAAEEVMVLRDLALVELTGARLHLQHLSTAGSVRALREAKARGLPVTGEAAPHHFTLVDADVGAYDTHAKMTPPLRAPRDRDAIREALADGTLDAIATDHAPHGPLEKDTVFEAAANGIVGLETALSLGLQLVREGVFSRGRLIALLTSGPASVIPAFKDLGTLKVGGRADVTVIDPVLSWVVTPEGLRSKSKNSPFVGRQLTGRSVLTVVGGQVVFGAERLSPPV